MLRNLFSYLLLHFIVFIWGFTGILGKLIRLDSLTITWWRVVIAFVGLGIFLFFSKWNFKIQSRKVFFSILGVGVFVALHWLLFYKSIQLSTASLAVLCLSTTTLHVSWLEPLIAKRPFLWSEFVSGLVVIGALAYVSLDFHPSDYLALFLGLTSAFMASLFSVCNAKLVNDTPSETISFYEFGIACVVLSLFLLSSGRLNFSLFQMTLSDLLWLLFLGLVCTSFAFLVMIKLMKQMGAFTVSLSINMEPVYTIFLAIAILNENELLSNKFYIGAFFIVITVCINAVLKYRMKLKNTHAL